MGNKRKTPPLRKRKRHGGRQRQTPVNAFGVWLEGSGATVAKVATTLGASTQWVYNVMRGHTKPSRERAVKIEQLTSGAVPVSVW